MSIKEKVLKERVKKEMYKLEMDLTEFLKLKYKKGYNDEERILEKCLGSTAMAYIFLVADKD